MKIILVLLLTTLLFSFTLCDSIVTTFHLAQTGLDTCDILAIGGYFIPYNSCSLVNTGAQANCTVYLNCLLSTQSFDAYQACLPNTTQAYIQYSAVNATFYQQQVFSDDTCTSLVSTTYVPLGCVITPIMDASNVTCQVNTFESISTTSAASYLEGFWF
jgi:hypothetical protein